MALSVNHSIELPHTEQLYSSRAPKTENHRTQAGYHSVFYNLILKAKFYHFAKTFGHTDPVGWVYKGYGNQESEITVGHLRGWNKII